MCTLTLVPLGAERFRLAFNRDEQRSRAAGLPPCRRRIGRRTAVFPVDTVRGGTWIGVNDAGLVLALLNVNLPRDGSRVGPRTVRQSRGALIPALLGCDDLGEALHRAEKLHPEDYSPFRLVFFGGGEVADLRWDGKQRVRADHGRLHAPRLLTSSGLGDHLVQAPRRHLFEEMFAGTPDLVATQNAFHRHSWPGREHLSICMRRSDACTVSYTVMELTEADIALTYYPGAPDEGAPGQTVRVAVPQVSVR